jgi:hypothetical protein
METFQIGDQVIDDLTGDLTSIEKILVDRKLNVGYILECKRWLDGYRFDWEVSDPLASGECEVPEYECAACGHTTTQWDEYKNHFHFCEGD